MEQHEGNMDLESNNSESSVPSACCCDRGEDVSGIDKKESDEKVIGSGEEGMLEIESAQGTKKQSCDEEKDNTSISGSVKANRKRRKRNRHRRKNTKSGVATDNGSEIKESSNGDEPQTTGEEPSPVSDEFTPILEMNDTKSNDIQVDIIETLQAAEHLEEESANPQNETFAYTVPEEFIYSEEIEETTVAEVFMNETVKAKTLDGGRTCAATFDQSLFEKSLSSNHQHATASAPAMLDTPEVVVDVIYQASGGFRSDTSVAAARMSRSRGLVAVSNADLTVNSAIENPKPSEIIAESESCSDAHFAMIEETVGKSSKTVEMETKEKDSTHQSNPVVVPTVVFPEWATAEDMVNNNYLLPSEDLNEQHQIQDPQPISPTISVGGIADILEQNLPDAPFHDPSILGSPSSDTYDREYQTSKPDFDSLRHANEVKRGLVEYLENEELSFIGERPVISRTSLHKLQAPPQSQASISNQLGGYDEIQGETIIVNHTDDITGQSDQDNPPFRATVASLDNTPNFSEVICQSFKQAVNNNSISYRIRQSRNEETVAFAQTPQIIAPEYASEKQSLVHPRRRGRSVVARICNFLTPHKTGSAVEASVRIPNSKRCDSLELARTGYKKNSRADNLSKDLATPKAVSSSRNTQEKRGGNTKHHKCPFVSKN